MHLITTCLLSLAGFVAALPVENGVLEVKTDIVTRNSVIEEIILDIIEQLRDVMIHGSDDIPVLDPLKVEHIHLQLDDFGLVNSHVEATETVVTGLSTFVIDNFSFTSAPTILQPFRHVMVMELHIPAVESISKKYDLSVTALDFTVFGKGEATVRMTEPKLRMNMMVNLSLLGGISLRILSADVRIGMTAFESGLTGIFHDEYLTDFINLFLGELIPQMLEYFEDDISEILSTLVVVVGNEILENINIGDLLPMDEGAKLAGLPVPDVAIA